MKFTFTCAFCVVVLFKYGHSLPLGGYLSSVYSDETGEANSPQLDVNQFLRHYYTAQSEKELNGFNNPFQVNPPMYEQSAQQFGGFGQLPDENLPVGYGPSAHNFHKFAQLPEAGFPVGYGPIQHFSEFSQLPETGLNTIYGPPQQYPIPSNMYHKSIWPEAKYEAPYSPFGKSDYMFSSVDSNPLTSYTPYNKQIDPSWPSLPVAELSIPDFANHKRQEYYRPQQFEAGLQKNPFPNEEEESHSGASNSMLSYRSLDNKNNSSATPKQHSTEEGNKKD